MTPSSPSNDSATEPLDVTVVIPCLNEEKTVGQCVATAVGAIQAAGLTGEVIVADNGSRDASRERAAAAGARIVPVARRGYGSALMAGISAARSRYVIMGDADASYGAKPRAEPMPADYRAHTSAHGPRVHPTPARPVHRFHPSELL